MPKPSTIERARQLKREGKSASTQAGEYVRETIEDIRKGKHGARNTKQAIAIGLSKARRAGVKIPPPKQGKASEDVRQRAERELEQAQHEPGHEPNPKRSKATTNALKRESRKPASSEALAKQARDQARHRTPAERSASAKKGAQTRLAHQSSAERRRIARKAARTRKAHSHA